MRKLLLVGATLAMPFMGTLAFAGAASAKTLTPVSCTTAKGKVSSSGAVKINLTKCNDPKNTGGSGKISTTETATTGTIVWNGTGTTVITNGTPTVISPGTCASGDIEEEETGTITGGTGAALKSIPIGWTSQAFVCYDPSNSKLSLAPGTTYQISSTL